jgi:hypothetical protein
LDDLTAIHRVGLGGTGKSAVGFRGRVSPPSWAVEGEIASHTGAYRGLSDLSPRLADTWVQIWGYCFFSTFVSHSSLLSVGILKYAPVTGIILKR